MRRFDVVLLLLFTLNVYGWALSLGDSGGSRQPYCNRNITAYNYNTTTVTMRTIRACCKGYTNSMEVCRPVCDRGCPNNAICVEPNVCQCAKGYVYMVSETHGIRTCEAVCEKECPKHSRCTELNVCNCYDGYKVEKQDENDGACKKPIKFRTTQTTQRPDDDDDDDYYDSDEYDSSDRQIDANEKIYLRTEMPLVSCSNDSIYYKGECHLQTFASGTIDCKVRGCPDYASCEEDGNCVCESNFNSRFEDLSGSNSKHLRECYSFENNIHRISEQSIANVQTTYSYRYDYRVIIIIAIIILTIVSVWLLALSLHRN